MALFIVSTKDGWVDIMHKGIDAVGVDMEVGFCDSFWSRYYLKILFNFVF